MRPPFCIHENTYHVEVPLADLGGSQEVLEACKVFVLRHLSTECSVSTVGRKPIPLVVRYPNASLLRMIGFQSSVSIPRAALALRTADVSNRPLGAPAFLTVSNR